MESILERLTKGEVLVADGAMGTLLMEQGLQLGDCPEKLNLDNPKVLEEIASAYLKAGADIIQTNSFGASPIKLSDFELEEKTEEINTQAVQIVRKTVGDRAYISGSCGPTGKLLAPYGDLEPEVLYHGFLLQLKSLIRAWVDLICIETMTDLQEAILAVRAARIVSKTIPIMATMTFDPTSNGFFTIMGVSVQDAIEGLQNEGADILGANCGHGMDTMVKLAREMRKLTPLPIIIQSNAGLPVIKDDLLFYPETPKIFERGTKKLIDIGVNIIGGCCGTAPEHIQRIRSVVDKKS